MADQVTMPTYNHTDTVDVDEDIFVSPFDWNLLTFCTTLFLLSLLALSFLLNLSTACIVCSRSKLRRYGYFHQIIFFCALHVAYFFIKASKFTLDSLALTDVVMGDLYSRVISATAALPDALICLLGTNLLVLTSMSTDCLVMSKARRGSSAVVRCSRVTCLLVALVLGSAAFCVALFFKYNVFSTSVDNPLGQRDSMLVVYGVYLVSFALVPAVFIVIFGTVNWVSETHSNRQVKTPHKVGRSLDHQGCVEYLQTQYFALL
jgi:hypothetical protein